MSNLEKRAIKHLRNASTNLERAAGDKAYRSRSPDAKAAKLLTVFANSMEFHGTTNRVQVEGALADYYDALDRESI